MQFQHVHDRVYYVPGASNVGLVVGEDHQGFLVDSGVGQRSGRQLWQLLQEAGLRLAAILNTHGHGDHAGGNAHLVSCSGAKVYASAYDSVVLRNPVWGTMCTFSGADPITQLSTPRFAPQPSPVDVVVTEGIIEVAGVQVEVVPLPGHTGSHTGYLVDNVLFTGDALAGEEELGNAPVPYAYSVTGRLASLEKLRSCRCAAYVLGHGSLQRDITQLVERNVAQVMSILGFVKDLLAQRAMDAGEILQAVCVHYEINIRNVRQYFLLFPALHAYLSHLNNQGEIECYVDGGRLLWHPAERRDAC